MNQPGPNKKVLYSMILSVLMCITVLVIATGTAFARYRAERNATITFRVRVPDQVHLGTVSIAENSDSEELVKVFNPSSQLTWTVEGDTASLQFAVANGQLEDDYSERDQSVRLRMIGTLGIWTGTQVPTLYLTLPAEDEDTEPSVVTATVSRITEGTALYLTYGDGWVYTFLDEEGEEVSWELEGGELSFIELSVTINDGIPDDLTLLKPKVIAETIRD